MRPHRGRVLRGYHIQRPWVVTCHCGLAQRFHFWHNAVRFADRHVREAVR